MLDGTVILQGLNTGIANTALITEASGVRKQCRPKFVAMFAASNQGSHQLLLCVFVELLSINRQKYIIVYIHIHVNIISVSTFKTSGAFLSIYST